MKINFRKYEQGDAHTGLLLLIFVAMVGVVGYFGYNAWQKQQVNAGGTATVASAQSKVNTVEKKLAAAKKTESETKRKLDSAIRVAAKYDATTADDDEETPDPADNKERSLVVKKSPGTVDKAWQAKYNSALKALVAKRRAEAAKSPTLKKNYDKMVSARSAWTKARSERTAAQESLLVAMNAYKKNDSDKNEATLKKANATYKKLKKKTSDALKKFHSDRKAYQNTRNTWAEYKAYDKIRQPKLKAEQEVRTLRSKLIDSKEAVTDLEDGLVTAKKALNKAKKAKANAPAPKSTPKPAPAKTATCQSGYKVNSTKTACYKTYAATVSTVLECPAGYSHYEINGAIHKSQCRRYSAIGDYFAYKSKVSKKVTSCTKGGSYDQSLKACVVTSSITWK